MHAVESTEVVPTARACTERRRRMRPFSENGFMQNEFFAPKRGMFHADPGYPMMR